MAMYRHVGPPMGGVQAFIRHFRCVACVRLALSLGRGLAGGGKRVRGVGQQRLARVAMLVRSVERERERERK